MQPNEAIWSVSALNFEIKTILEKGIGSIWIDGEISNFSNPSSGHWYFSLKDERAQLRAAMFKNRNLRVQFRPENGQQVLIRAQVTLYEARGDFQVIVEHMEEAGSGQLMRQFEALKKQLTDEGLFAAQHKKIVPAQARHIGLISSPTGAAIHDALSVIRRRSPSTQVTVLPTSVQGVQASPQIIKAIELANRMTDCDVLLLIRGGGSLEDLWCFNDESVIRAIFESRLPIISGIGHEVDFTLTDMVADIRAPTPSVAAETVTVDQYELITKIDLLEGRLNHQFLRFLELNSERLNKLRERITAFHPRRQMDALNQRLGFAISRLKMTQSSHYLHSEGRFELAVEKFSHQNPEIMLPALNRQIETLNHQLRVSMQTLVQHTQQRLALRSGALDNLSPLKTLSRGYAAITKQGRLIGSAKQLKSDDEVRIQLADGKKQARIL